MFVVVWTPEPTREYGEAEVVGPFASRDEACNYMAEAVVTSEGWLCQVCEVEDYRRER